MDIKDLKFFALVAEMKHITKAATQLGVSQPYLSKMIHQLEEELNVKLIDTSKRTVTLTYFGDLFYAHAKKVLNEFEILHLEIESAQGFMKKQMRFATNIEYHLYGLLEAYINKYPSRSVSTVQCKIEDALYMLSTGQTDFFLHSPPLTDKESLGLCTRVLPPHISLLLLPPGHPLLDKEYIVTEDLFGLPIATSQIGFAIRDNQELFFKRNNYYPSIALETTNLEMMINYVMSGNAIAVLPAPIVFEKTEIIPYLRPLNRVGHPISIGLSYNPSYVSKQDGDELFNTIKELYDTRTNELYIPNSN